MSYFDEQDITLQPLGMPNTGLRPGQLGSLHSVLAHFSVYDEPALISLPTGYGKTAVLMALPFILRAKRLLVIEPSDALRRQTCSHMKELSTLRKLNVIPEDLPNPLVWSQKGRPESDEEWAKLADHDVVVSTPQSISPALSPNPSNDLFDLIIFDEAHHAPAETWSAILNHYKDSKFVFLTATPFRRDRRLIPGRMAYWYPVSKASREEAFGRVSFTAAQVSNDNDDNEIDLAVARAAVKQLNDDRKNGYDHRIFARAASISKAGELVSLYEQAGAKVRSINSHIAKRTQDKVESDLITGELDGVICVDMFGEGYDFPKLKIAALHAPHRSLVPTLQFIGRFARTNDVSTGPATLVAPISRLKDASVKLFKEGVDISEMIDEVAQEQIADAEADREVLDVLKTRRQVDSDYDAVTPLLLELYAHAQIYECQSAPDFSKFEDTVGRNLKIAKQWTSDDGAISLLLTVDTTPPSWATSDVLVNVRHDAFLFGYNEASKLCFIGSTRRTARIYHDLIQTACPDQHKLISFERTRQALRSLVNLRFYNVGLRNTAINSQAESYRTMTGPAAERAITAGDARAYSQGHFFGSGVGAGSERETIGASGSSRIWSNKRLTVAEYLAWITQLNVRLTGEGEIASSKLDIIQHAKTLKSIPPIVIAGGWHKQAFRLAPRIRYRRNEGDAWTYSQLPELEMADFSVSDDGNVMKFGIRSDDFSVSFEMNVSGGALFRQLGTETLEVMVSYEDWEGLSSWLNNHPPVFFSSDLSSIQGVNIVAAANKSISRLLEDDAISADWGTCDIGTEFGKSKSDGLLTVHEYIAKYLLESPNLEALIYDHRTGEAADYVSFLKEETGAVRVQLFHCKAAGGAPSGGRVDDVYEVAGQMVKSVSYCDSRTIVEHLERRINPSRQKKPSEFMKGDLDHVRALLDGAPATELTFEIYGVQPGISLKAIDDHLAGLMAYGLDFVQRGGAARAAWLINA